VPDTQKGSYEVDATVSNLPIYKSNFTLEEVGRAVRKLENGGAPGSDYAVTPEALKFCGKALREKSGLQSGASDSTAPHILADKHNSTSAKKGQPSQMRNKRGISLKSVAAKVYNRMLLDRIIEEVNQKLRPNQAGYRREMNCLLQIHTILMIMEALKGPEIRTYH